MKEAATGLHEMVESLDLIAAVRWCERNKTAKIVAKHTVISPWRP